MKKAIFIPLLLLFTVVTTLSGDELRGQFFDDTISTHGHRLVLNGLGLRQMTIFKVKVYVAALYLEHASADGAKILKSHEHKKLDIVFLRDVEAKDIVHSWDEGFARNCEVGCEALKPQLMRLDSLMTDVKKGQKVSFYFQGNQFELSTPGKAPVVFDSPGFSEMILATFIGKQPPSEELKAGMLGLDKKEATARELAASPSPP